MSTSSRIKLTTYRVRPAMRVFAIIAFAIVLPVGALNLWDYLEVRRFAQEIEKIRAQGDPINSHQDSRVVTDEPEASTYYLAAAILALPISRYPVISSIHRWLADPSIDRTQPKELASAITPLLANGREALSLADKAAAMPFKEFPAGTDYAYRSAAVETLLDLLAARTMSLAVSGYGDAAIDSLESGLRAHRALRKLGWTSGGSLVAAVLSLSRPSPKALAQLQTALESEEDPKQSIEYLLWERANYIDLTWRIYHGRAQSSASVQYGLLDYSAANMIWRPWFVHKATYVLRVWAELVKIAKISWPDDASAVVDTIVKYRAGRSGPDVDGIVSQAMAISAYQRAFDAVSLIRSRCSLVAIAIERYRSDHGVMPNSLSMLVPDYLRAVPTDPFSKGPLLFHSTPNGYTIYSVGPNRTDDRGNLHPEENGHFGRGPNAERSGPRDIGVRVLAQP